MTESQSWSFLIGFRSILVIQELVVDIQTREGSVIGSFYIVTGEFIEWYRTKLSVPYNHLLKSVMKIVNTFNFGAFH